jgi:hypothetical protein
MVEDGVMPSRHLLLHACRQALRIAKKAHFINITQSYPILVCP